MSVLEMVNQRSVRDNMKCKVCGAESGKYPLCKECNRKKEAGEIIKCAKCHKWHYSDACEMEADNIEEDNIKEADKETEGNFLYQLKPSLVTDTEMSYLNCIKEALPEGYLIQPQANLASFISRTDGAKYQNELYRNVDFIITDQLYKPLVLVEINDQTHLSHDRIERDKKVIKICEEAGIPIIKLWTSYGVNQEYIKKRIDESIAALPVKRVHHFIKEKGIKKANPSKASIAVNKGEKKGCYIATCIYGSYDCPQVWILRRFRDYVLDKTWYGRAIIKCYYAVSPTLVKWFGDHQWFKIFWKSRLDKMTDNLRNKGIDDTYYKDK